MESSEVLRLDAEPELSLVAIDGAIPERQGHLFNWEELQIEEWLDDGGEGRMELIDEDKMYCLLGLRTEDDDGQSAANATSSAAIPDQATANDDGQSAANANATSSAAIPDIDTRGAAIPVDDAIPEESARRYTTTPTAAWVASRGMKYLIKDSNMGPNQLRKELEAEHGCTIGYDVVADGRNIANKILHGTWEDSFQLLYNWRAEILKHSPNSVIEIDTLMVDGKVHFYRFFCALSPCVEGFLEGCRPYLSIDSTALNGRWNGHLASATALDGHNWMYPVAFGFIDGETTDNWQWFMTELHKAIGDPPHLAICTDACKGLETAVKDVFPHAEHRECFRHLMQNFLKKFGGDSFSKMYPAARAYRPEVFTYFFTSVKEASDQVLPWLEKNHNLLWMRSAFNPEVKCDYITNNLAECFNNWIKDWKDLPVCEFADKIREKVMVLWRKRRQIGQKLNGRILPGIVRQLKMRTRGLGHLTIISSDTIAAEIWEVNTIHNRHVVKTYLHECTCLEWQHTGKPCQHALALITAQQTVDVDLEPFVHEYFSVQNFKNAYKRLIEPIPDRTQWPIVELPFKVWAPLDKKGAGRYRKLRIKGCLEGGSGGKGKKAAKEAANEADNAAAEEEAMQAGKPKRQLLRGKRTCKGCGELGHTESSYKCRLNGTKKRKRKPRLNTTKYGKNGEKKSKKAAQNSPVHAAEPPVGAENEVVVPENVIVVAENALVVAENALAPQPENALAQPENALAQPENALAQPENAPVTDKANILANSPERLTRSRLAEIIGEGPSTLLNVTKPNKQAKTSPKQRKKQAKTSPKKAIAKKLTPRKLKTT